MMELDNVMDNNGYQWNTRLSGTFAGAAYKTPFRGLWRGARAQHAMDTPPDFGKHEQLEACPGQGAARTL